MKSKFQLSAVAIALATITGSVIAAPTPITDLANDTKYGQYDRILGQEESITSSNGKRNEDKADAVDNTTVVSKAANEATTATVVEANGTKYLSWSLTDERRAGSEQTKTQSIYDTNIAASEEASIDSKIVWTNNTTQQTGTAVHGGAVLQQLQVDAQGNPVKDAQGNYMTVGSKFRADDTQFSFTADDLTKVGDATKVVNNSTYTGTQYKSGQVLDYTSENSYENVNESNAIAYDTNGKAKQSNGTTDFIVTGTHKDNGTSKTATYQNGKNELAYTSDSTSDRSETDASYHYDNKGNFAFTDADADGKNAYNVSNVTSSEEKTSNSYKQYQANQTKVYESANSNSGKETRTDVFDGFVSTDESTSQGSYVEYGTGKHTLSFEQKDSGTSATKSREFERNTDGTLVLKDGKPVVDTEIETKGTYETYDSAYQPKRYTKAEAEADAKLKPEEQRGIYEGQPYNQQILNDGWKTSWTDSSVAKSTEKGTSSKVTTHKQDNNFQTWEKSTVDNSSTYARNQQENIEVNRDISNSFTSDSKTLNKAYKVGEVVTKAGEDDQFALGTVRVNINGYQYDGRLVSQGGDVHTWKDEAGKDRYYVVIGTDDEGSQVRSEVTYKNGKPAETKDVLVDVVNTTVTADKRTDKVTMGEEVAYSTNSAIKNETATTSRDGKIVYESNKFNESTDKKVYSIGKNALDYQKVIDGSEETVYSNYQLDNANKVVVTSVDTTKDTWKNTTQQYQPGQEKSLVNSSLESWNNTRTAGDKEVAYDRGNAESTFTQYNEGKNVLDRTTVSKETGENKGQYVQEVTTDDIRPVNEFGTKITAGGVLATDEQGQAVTSKAMDTVAIVEFDKVAKTTSNVDEKVFQTGATAYSKTTSDSSDAVLSYADKSAGYEKSANSEGVKLYNHGESDKYRDYTSVNTESSKHNLYELNAKGAATLSGTVEKSESTNKAEVNYQAGKNALDNSTKTITESAETTVMVGTTKAVKEAATSEILTYQEGQELVSASASIGSGEEKLTKADGTGYTYSTADKSDSKSYNTRTGLLAEREVLSTSSIENTETLAATGKNTVSIVRGSVNQTKTDTSATETIYGSETMTVADGSKTMLSKKETGVNDKFGITESETLNRTETTIGKDGSSSAMSTTRVDTVDGVILTKEKIVQPAAGTDATSTVVASTEIKAGEIKVGDVVLSADKGLDAGQRAVTGVGKGVADTDAVNVSQMNESRAQANSYTDGRVNQVSRKLDNVERTAYRGVAIALAAQQAVPNIQPGQVALFGGVGHYEGETAGSIGVVTSFTNRISASGAFGFAGSSSFGGRVGVSYLFGGN